MKVASVSHAAQFNPYAEIKRISSSPCAGPQPMDKLELDSARQFQELLKAADEVPEVRAEKVEAIKRQIEEGSYQVSGQAVADKILESVSTR